MNESILNLSLCEIADEIRSRRVTSEEVTRAALERANAVQPHVNCFISIEDDAALQAARDADTAIRRGEPTGPLHGVPLAHKDMFYRAGQITTGGSRLLHGFRPQITATVAERIATAGAIWLGNLNMSEFAANPTGHNESFGHCKNAWNQDCISGGSSSGSAVAVAARACFASLGSDTGGSVRLPAAANGVTGIRPTYGRVSRYGILPRTWSLDTVGPLARSVRDCARLLRVIAGSDPMDSTTSAKPVPDYEKLLDGKIDGLKIGVPENYFFDGLTDEVQRCMDESLRQMASQGARIVRLPVPDPKLLHQLANLVSQVEAASIHSKWLEEWGDDYPLILRTRIESGFLVPAVAYLDALSARARLTAEFVTQVFGQVDVLLTPALSMPAPTFAEITPNTSGDVMPMLARMSRCTRPFSFLGLPALSVPAGMSGANLPIGMQLIGRPFDEALLFKVGDAYQRETGWDLLAPQFSNPR